MDENTIKLFQSKLSDEWETPQDRYDEWNKEFKFNLDACATAENCKYPDYFSLQNDAITMDWWGRVFCNPPYSKVKEFLKKATEEMQKGHCEVIVFLTFANTDTRWFHDYVYGKAEIRFIKGRLKFKGKNKKGEIVNNSAMRPSILIIFRKVPKIQK
jgi:site-specific DNA-methyltransferase (adenine-specific)